MISDKLSSGGDKYTHTFTYLGEEKLAMAGETVDVVKIRFHKKLEDGSTIGNMEEIWYFSKKFGTIVSSERLPYVYGSYTSHGGMMRLLSYELK